MVSNYIQRPLPLITPRIEYICAPPPPLPTVTPRIEFNLERLTHPSGTLGEDERQRLGNRRLAIRTDYQEEDRESRVPNQEPDRPPSALSRALPSNKIPKPPGEPGRPGSGGFCVETTLVDTHNWTKEAVDDLSVCEYISLDWGLIRINLL